jgi:hypothetical protein
VRLYSRNLVSSLMQHTIAVDVGSSLSITGYLNIIFHNSRAAEYFKDEQMLCDIMVLASFKVLFWFEA